MRHCWLAWALLPVLCGCQATQVAENSVTLAAESKYVQEQQVLDNLAMLAAEPSALPHYSTMLQGQDQLARTAQITYTPGWDFVTTAGAYLGRYLFDKQTAAIQGTNQNQESIQVSPLSDPDKLLLLQAAFHRALGIADPEDVEEVLNVALDPSSPKTPSPTKPRPLMNLNFKAANPLELKISGPSAPDTAVIAKGGPLSVEISSTAPPPAKPRNWQHYENMVGTGWFCIVSRKKDVPRNACRVGHYCNTYVYVLPGHDAELARMTFAVLHLVSVDLTKLTIPPQKAKAVPGVAAPESALEGSEQPQPLAPQRIQTFPLLPVLPSPSPT